MLASRVAFGIVSGLCGLLLGLTLCGAVYLELHGLRARPDASADWIIVAGCAVEPDGRASTCLAERVDAAVELWQQGYAPRIAFTGAQQGDAPASEADVARRRAIARGVPEAATAVEERSTSTAGNAREASRVALGQRVIVVTHSFHVLRAVRCFQGYYPEVSAFGVAGASMWTRVYGAMREVAALGYYAATGRLNPVPIRE